MKKADVVILGGGLAGLTLASQLRSEHNDLDIVILEKNRFPVPKYTAKVGESTVEIGSHYLASKAGMAEHLDTQHLRKFGLRVFFGDNEHDIAAKDELGSSQYFGLPTYQIDRGSLENELYQRLVAKGVRIEHGVETEKLVMQSGNHQAHVRRGQGRECYGARWLVDTAGRRGLVKNTLSLGKTNAHQGHALWFRVDRRIELDDWSDDGAWRQRCVDGAEGKRWLSTNHLTGPGYWVWIIPLAGGATSIGIVMDDVAMADSGINTMDDTRRWLERHQPQCAEAIDGATVLDFCLLKDYSYDCKKVFSTEGWALSGEAGVFIDPFYSPGTDFIAMGNDYITQLIGQSRLGKDLSFTSSVYQMLFDSIYKSTLSIYANNYGCFGDRRTMGLKVLWDFCYYWGVLAWLYFRGMLTDIDAMREVNSRLLAIRQTNINIQQRFNTEAAKRIVRPSRHVFIDQYQVPCLRHLNDMLVSNKATMNDLSNNVSYLQDLAIVIEAALDDQPVSEAERELCGAYAELCR